MFHFYNLLPQLQIAAHAAKTYGIGARPAAMHAAWHFPNALLQPIIAAGVPTSAVTVPNTAPAPV